MSKKSRNKSRNDANWRKDIRRKYRKQLKKTIEQFFVKQPVHIDKFWRSSKTVNAICRECLTQNVFTAEWFILFKLDERVLVFDEDESCGFCGIMYNAVITELDDEALGDLVLYPPITVDKARTESAQMQIMYG